MQADKKTIGQNGCFKLQNKKAMKVAFFSPKLYDREYFDKFNHFFGHMPDFIETRLNSQTVRLAKDYDAKSAFVLDKADQPDQYT